MKCVHSCEYNMDTAWVELQPLDGSMISVDTAAMGNEAAGSLWQRFELADLDAIIRRRYEGSALESLAVERNRKMAADKKTGRNCHGWKLRAWADTQENRCGVAAFIVLTRKYVDVTALMPTIFNEYIKKIAVPAPYKHGERCLNIDGEWKWIADCASLAGHQKVCIAAL